MRFNYIAAFAAFAVSVPAISHAQLGGLVRKAQNAAANKVIENKNLKPSSAFGPELTAETLDAVLRGLAATDAKLAESDRHRETRMKLDDRLSKSLDAHQKDRENYDNLRNKTDQCQSDFRDKQRNALEAELDAKRADPAFQAKMMQITLAFAPKLGAAQQKGDTAEYRRLVLEMTKAQGLDPVADSAAVINACGRVPAKPAWLVEQDSIRALSARSDSQVRQAEESAQAAGAAASGMPGKNAYAMARERVMHWYMERRGASPIQHFGADERKLMEGKRDAIMNFSRALQGGA
jgi:hypothetical protein